MNALKDTWLPLNETPDLLGQSRRHIQRRCKQGDFITTVSKANGGNRIEILLSSLPVEAQKKFQEINPTALELVNENTIKYPYKHALTANDNIPEKYLRVASHYASLLCYYTEYYRDAEFGKILKLKNEFINDYNTGCLYSNIFSIVGPVKFKTIERDRKRYVDSGKNLYSLLPAHLGKMRLETIPEKQQKILIAILLSPNAPLRSEVIRSAKRIFASKGYKPIYSDKTYDRFILRWRDRNYDRYLLMREGAKALNDKKAPFIERDYSDIQVGDIVVADGHVLNFTTINPHTGKYQRASIIAFQDMKSLAWLGFTISFTENTESISVALYRAILRLGKMPKVVYLDNGKAFKSKFFNNTDLEDSDLRGLYESLGIKVIFAWPYHGQSKMIERSFRSFAEIERRMPTYIGTSILKQPPYLQRGDSLHRSFHAKLCKDFDVDIISTYKAIAKWMDEYENRERKTGRLKGTTSFQLLKESIGEGIDKTKLKYLMMKKDTATIGRNGIRLFNNWYWSNVFYPLKGTVNIRYDLINHSEIFAYDNSGKFLCIAVIKDRQHPAAHILGDTEAIIKLQNTIHDMKSLKKQTALPIRKFLEEEILPAEKQRLLEAEIIRTENDNSPKTKEKKKASNYKATGTDNLSYLKVDTNKIQKEDNTVDLNF